MSYCRFSSDNYRCDVYCYACDGGYSIEVATHRITGDIPQVPERTDENYSDYIRAFESQMEFVLSAERVEIGLPYDGEDYLEPTELATAKRLESLRDAGYRVPQEVIDTFRSMSSHEQTAVDSEDERDNKPLRDKPAARTNLTGSDDSVQAQLKLLSGPNSGKTIQLTKSMTTIGKPGVSVAAITRRSTGFFLVLIECSEDTVPTLNGKNLSVSPQRLASGDVITVAGVEMVFTINASNQDVD